MASVHIVREMMMGTREKFRYGECGQCASLQLLDVPEDLVRYYPPDYYSLSGRRRGSPVIRLAKRVRGEAAMRGHARLARVIGLGGPVPEWPMWLRNAQVNRSAAICDIGCGNGDMLLDLKDQGFTNLTGADAFIPETVNREGIPIYKATPSEVPGRYDFVMLNHAFEHMPAPRETLHALRRLVKPTGALMLRLPVADSAAWREYGVHWFAIDAPRHLYVPSRRGLSELATDCGLIVERVVDDSAPWQWWRSDQYRRDIGLYEPQSYQVNKSAYSRIQMAAWRQRTAEVNARGEGDTAAFFLRPEATEG